MIRAERVLQGEPFSADLIRPDCQSPNERGREREEITHFQGFRGTICNETLPERNFSPQALVLIYRGGGLAKMAAESTQTNSDDPAPEQFREADLVAKSLAGDQEAFGVLIAQNQARLFNVVFRLIRDAEDAKDILQEAFMNAYLNLPKFQGYSKFSTWVYRIAINVAISHKRKRRPRAGGGDESEGRGGNQLDSLRNISGPQDAPDKRLEGEERRAEILATLNLLSNEHKSVLILKDMDNLKYETIAEILNVPIGTVRSRLNRARAELRARLKSKEDTGRGLGVKK